MLLSRLKLVNYGGIYNGLGLYEIEIDFTRCKHKLILIKGDNGSGKSTIENAIKPLPDDNSSFIEGYTARKEIEYYDNINGVIYNIIFIHEWKNNKRSNTKGFIKKSYFDTGESEELNPSGNITSCKEIIFSEFELDPGYITLSHLSNNNRGIAELRPSERKKYVASRLDSTTIYNEIYKKLSSKSTTYKTMLNNIVYKIKDIGDSSCLAVELNKIEDHINHIEKEIDRCKYSIANAEASIKLSDPDKMISDSLAKAKYNLIESSKEECNSYSYLKNLCARFLKSRECMIKDSQALKLPNESSSFFENNYYNILRDYINNRLSDCNTIISETESGIEIYKKDIQSILVNKEAIANNIQAKSDKLSSITSDTDFEELERILDSHNKKISEIESRWKCIVTDINSISKSEFDIVSTRLMSMWNDIKEIARELIKNNVSLTEFFDISEDIREKISTLNSNITKYKESISSLEKADAICDELSSQSEILEQRPIDCTNDNCPFIMAAIEASNKYNEMNQDKITEDLENTRKILDETEEMKSLLETIASLYETYSQLDKEYNTLKSTIDKIKISNVDLTLEFLLNSAMCNDSSVSNAIENVLQGYTDYSNDLEEYRVITLEKIKMDSEYQKLYSQKEFIDILAHEIERLNCDLNKCQDSIQRYNDLIIDYTKRLEMSKEAQTRLTDIESALERESYNYEKLNKDSSINKAMEEAAESIIINTKIINENNTRLQAINSELSNLNSKREQLNYKINLSVTYENEVKEYEKMYQKIETLKRYASPTSGIQVLFANMYMSKILSKANDLLTGLFGGRFALLPFVITPQEFRIPVAVNGGINHADITSMSSAQIALISMIISIALMSQSSSKLNIIIGDEIDAPFDSENRRAFIEILYKLMGMINSNQCILVSHNSEIDFDDCDIILLKNSNDIITGGNIIWRYL